MKVVNNSSAYARMSDKRSAWRNEGDKPVWRARSVVVVREEALVALVPTGCDHVLAHHVHEELMVRFDDHDAAVELVAPKVCGRALWATHPRGSAIESTG